MDVHEQIREWSSQQSNQKYVRAKPIRTTIRATAAIAEKKRLSQPRCRRGRAAVAISPAQGSPEKREA
jgi:hypothetical protein